MEYIKKNRIVDIKFVPLVERKSHDQFFPQNIKGRQNREKLKDTIKRSKVTGKRGKIRCSVGKLKKKKDFKEVTLFKDKFQNGRESYAKTCLGIEKEGEKKPDQNSWLSYNL